MTSWLGQYCINVDRSRAVGRVLRGARPRVHEPHRDRPGLRGDHRARRRQGLKLQLAQQKEQAGPVDLGNAFWKLYVNTHDIDAACTRAATGGRDGRQGAERLDRWPMSIAFVRDPDGYLVELVAAPPVGRHATRPTACGSASTASTSPTSTRRSRSTSCSASTCTSRTEIPQRP